MKEIKNKEDYKCFCINCTWPFVCCVHNKCTYNGERIRTIQNWSREKIAEWLASKGL